MSKAEIYRAIAVRYGFTPNEIANMTQYQQMVLLEIEEGTTTFRDIAEYQRWLGTK